MKTNPPKTEKRCQLNIEVDAELRHALKIAAVLNGMTMQEYGYGALLQRLAIDRKESKGKSPFEMVRGAGFEPATPTVSMSGPDSAVNSQFSQDIAQEMASGIRIVLENNRLHVRPLQGKQPVPIGGTGSPPPCPARIEAGGHPFCHGGLRHHHN